MEYNFVNVFRLFFIYMGHSSQWRYRPVWNEQYEIGVQVNWIQSCGVLVADRLVFSVIRGEDCCLVIDACSYVEPCRLQVLMSTEKVMTPT